MKLFYISFANRKFLGAVLVNAETTLEALKSATEQGLNPGGSAMIIVVPDHLVQTFEPLRGRLLSEQQIVELGPVIRGIPINRDVEYNVVCEDCNNENVSTTRH